MPERLILATFPLPPPFTIQMPPSGPVVMPRVPPTQPKVFGGFGGDGSPPHGYSLSVPLTVIAPVKLPPLPEFSLNHNRLSGPTVISTGVLLLKYSVMAPAGVILATTLALKSIPPSVNHTFPSGPATIP